MKTCLAIFAGGLFFSVAALASVAESKAMKSSDEKVAKAVAATNAACGTSIVAAIDWSKYDTVDYGKTKKEDALKWAGDYASYGLQGLAKLCKDADYKAAIGKVKKYSAVADSKTTATTFTMDQSTVVEHYGALGAGNANIDASLKKLF